MGDNYYDDELTNDGIDSENEIMEESKSDNNNNIIIKIQKVYYGYKTRKKLKKQDDKYSYKILKKCLKKYKKDLKFNTKINLLLSKKKRRNENFPSDISENIVKFVIFKKYGIMPCWDTDKGDLVINKLSLFKRIEVKGFMSNGPSSFGPTEKWDLLYFLDGRNLFDDIFKVYEVKLSNKNNIFRNIKVSKEKTFGNQADRGIRPRGCFDSVFKPQLKEHCKLIFNGHISELKC